MGFRTVSRIYHAHDTGSSTVCLWPAGHVLATFRDHHPCSGAGALLLVACFGDVRPFSAKAVHCTSCVLPVCLSRICPFWSVLGYRVSAEMHFELIVKAIVLPCIRLFVVAWPILQSKALPGRHIWLARRFGSFDQLDGCYEGLEGEGM